MIAPHHTISPGSLRPRVEGDFANDRVKDAIMSRLFGEPLAAAKIGRFTVIRELGRGGTGVVYAAYDEELERKVAVKLLHEGSDDQGTVDPHARLLREAQAMARLSHPHIVSVHEVGTHHGQVYIAMEFVHGSTLSAWLKQEARGWREIAEVFRQAAAGLAAAHEAGLVHRDFKPQNAMVGDEGRLRVLDFGLARADGDPHVFRDIERTRDSSSLLKALDASLTITGSLIGTPAYMAPEQFRGERAEPRSDQFALCVAFYEALFRERPFRGETLGELMSAVLAGEVREPTGPHKVPRALKAAILRGLQLKPEARHPSMESLLAAIDRVIEPRRRSWLAAGGLALGLAAGAAGVAVRASAPGSHCSTDDLGSAATLWNPARAADLAAKLSSIDQAAAEAWPRASARFDAYALAWDDANEEACLAAERRELSQNLYASRRACLADRWNAFAAALELVQTPDPMIAVRAADIADGLAPAAECGEPDELRRYTAAQGLDRSPELRSALTRADLYRLGGKLEQALAIVDAASPADAPRDPDLEAEYGLTRGKILATAGRVHEAAGPLRSAYFAALSVGRDRLAIAAALELVALHSEGLAEFSSAELWTRHARALIGRGGGPALQAAVTAASGQLYSTMGRHLDARRELTRALELYEQLGRGDDPHAGRVRRLLADTAVSLSEFDEAEDQLDQALVTLRRDYCERHPDVAAGLYSRAKLALIRGDVDGALAGFESTLASIRGVVTADSRVVLRLTSGAASARSRRGDDDGAEELLRGALAAVEHAARDKPVDGLSMRPEVYEIRLDLAALATRRGRPSEGEALARDTLAAAARAWGSDEPYLAQALISLSEALLAQHRTEDARAAAEQAWTLASNAQGLLGPCYRAPIARAYARTLAPSDPDRARELSREADSIAPHGAQCPPRAAAG